MIYLDSKARSLALLSLIFCGLTGCAVSPEVSTAQQPSQIKPASIDTQAPVKKYGKQSIVHVGGNDTFAITQDGRNAGNLLFQALTKKDKNAATQAIELWNKIIPKENYGGEYSALQWFATYFLANSANQKAMLADPYVTQVFHFFADHNFRVLKEYLKRKYHSADVGDEETYAGQNRKALLEDTILFGNPRREEWEKTSQFLQYIAIKPGQTVADLGAGPGYYTFKFANKTGPSGKVYAIDTVKEHLKNVSHIAERTGIKNIEIVHTDGKTLGLAGKKVDAVFACSLYHNIYAMSTETERSELLESIKSALADDGVLYLLDNGLVPPGTLPYHGPYIDKTLLIDQLSAYGFELIADQQPIAQRYLLAFKKSTSVAATTQ